MIIDLNSVNVSPKRIDEIVTFPESYLADSEIRRLENVHVVGDVRLNDVNEYVYYFDVEGTMILPDCYTLEDYPYDFSFNIDENLDESAIFYDKLQNTLDIMEILWQNIVLEVPIRVGKDNGALKNGEGWELVDENTKKIDPRLAKLEELLKD